MSRPDPTPEGALIKARLKRIGLSQRALAEKVKLSEARVRQVINGYASIGAGRTTEVVAPAETVARLALAAGIVPDDMRSARSDAASLMEQWAENETNSLGLSSYPTNALLTELKLRLGPFVIAPNARVEHGHLVWDDVPVYDASSEFVEPAPDAAAEVTPLRPPKPGRVPEWADDEAAGGDQAPKGQAYDNQDEGE